MNENLIAILFLIAFGAIALSGFVTATIILTARLLGVAV